MKVERADIVKLLHASDIDKPPEIASFSEDLQGRLANIDTGSIIYLFKGIDIYTDAKMAANFVIFIMAYSRRDDGHAS